MTLATPEPQFRQLAELLRTAVEDGEHAPGSQLPSEDELAERYGVSRRTVNRALGILRADGVVRVERGRGTMVRDLPLIRREAAMRQRIRETSGARGAFQAEMTRLGLRARSDVSVSEEPAPADIAALLGIASGDRAIARRRRMYANDVPVQLATSWLPPGLAADGRFAQADSGPGGIYSRLAELGRAPQTFTEAVRMRPPTVDEVAFLRLDAEQRVLAIRRQARDSGECVVEVNDMTLPAHQWELVYTWTAAES